MTKIKVKVNAQRLNAKIKKAQEDKAQKLLTSVCDAWVDEAISAGNYTDRTGNLRSSIGGFVKIGGKIIHESGFRGNTEGSETGRNKAIQKINKVVENGFVGVVGMHYAGYVEDKGFNVRDSADRLVKKMIESAK